MGISIVVDTSNHETRKFARQTGCFYLKADTILANIGNNPITYSSAFNKRGAGCNSPVVDI